MVDTVDQGAFASEKAVSRWDAALVNAARAAGPPLLFELRLWASALRKGWFRMIGTLVG